MRTLVRKALLSSKIVISDGNRGLSGNGEAGPFGRRTGFLQLVLNWSFPPCFCSHLLEIPKTVDKSGKKIVHDIFPAERSLESECLRGQNPQPPLPRPS